MVKIKTVLIILKILANFLLHRNFGNSLSIDKVSMSYLFSFSIYLTKCVIKFLFRQLLMSKTSRFILNHPQSQWMTGENWSQHGNTKNLNISRMKRAFQMKEKALFIIILRPTVSFKQCLVTQSPFKMMKNAFYCTSKALFILKIFKFLFWLFCHVAKLLVNEDTINFKFYGVTAWLTNNHNTHIAQYFNKWGEWPSGSRRWNQDRKVPGSNSTRCLAGLANPPSLRGSQWPSGLICKSAVIIIGWVELPPQ